MKKNSLSSKNTHRAIILNKLFPEGIDETKIWNSLVSIIGGGEHQQLSIERLKVITDRKFKIKQRINKFFPGMENKLYIVLNADIDFLHHITQVTWVFSESHKVYSRDAIILHGHEPDEILLDWAAQAVVTMLLRHIKVSIETPGC